MVQSPLLRRLQGLHLTGCAVGDDGAELLADCEHLKQLRTLRLGQNAVGDRGVETLTVSRFLAELDTLVLHGNLIGDLGLACWRLARGYRDCGRWTSATTTSVPGERNR